MKITSMNRKRQYGTLAATVFAATLVATLALVPLADQQAFARPNPDPTQLGEHVMKINLKGVPTDNDAKCNGNSNNIYMNVPTKQHQHVDVAHGSVNTVTDNCTENIDGSRAGVTLDDPDTEYFLTIRLLGPPSSDLKFCSQIFSDHEDEETEHCVLDSVMSHKGKPKFTLTGKVFGDATEDQVWNFEGNSKFRIAQLDIWKAPVA
jgi:hypothetical protein